VRRIAVIALIVTLAGCGAATRREEAHKMTGGFPDRGKQAIRHYGCGSCHTIPGVPGATASVGPSLDKWKGRVYIAGRLTNVPDNLLKFIQLPQHYQPGGAMPNLGVKPQDAKDIAAYLYTLE
jgi:cytochrome c